MKVAMLKDSLAKISINPENINWSEEYYERLVSEVVNRILAKNDLIQNYLTPFLVKHLEQYLDNPNLIFEKRKDEEARIINMEFELGQIKSKLNHLLGIGWEHSSNTEITMEEIRLMKAKLLDAIWRLEELEVLMNK